MSEDAATTHAPHGFDPLAGLLALLLPGLGHVYRGERWRGGYAALGVLGLVVSGLLIGGIDVVDSREDRWWFAGQALAGPVVIIADAVHQRTLKAEGPARRGLLSQSQNEPVVRSGFPDERRVVDGSGRAVWERLTPEQVASGLGPPSRKGVGKMNELGTLFVLVGGMLNLIVVLDALFPTVRAAEARA